LAEIENPWVTKKREKVFGRAKGRSIFDLGEGERRGGKSTSGVGTVSKGGGTTRRTARAIAEVGRIAAGKVKGRRRSLGQFTGTGRKIRKGVAKGKGTTSAAHLRR